MNNVLGILNLYDSPDLGPLSEKRAPATVSVMGRYAMMDFALSNFTNSGIDYFSILVKDNFRSVNKHVNSLKAWVTNTKIGNQNVLITEKGIRDPKYNTDLNNIKENEWIFNEGKFDYVIIQPGHIITQIDFENVLLFHKYHQADVTVVYAKVDKANKSFLNMSIPVFKDDTSQIYDLKINDGKAKTANISLQTYIINIDLLKKMLNARTRSVSITSALKEMFAKGKIKCYGYYYNGFLRGFESFDSFVQTEFDLLDFKPANDLFDHGWNTYTVTHNSFPAKYGKNASINNCYISNGCDIDGVVENSILSRDVKVKKGAVVKNSIILTGTIIGENAIIENALIDKSVVIGEKVKVKGKKTSLEYVRKGKVLK